MQKGKQNNRPLALKSDRIAIWRFADAPEALRMLQHETPDPEWLAFVPRAISGPDIDELIFGRAEPGCVSKYETPDGDIVYVGTSLNQAPDPPLAHPSALRGTASKSR